jgi:hypothetical protein
MMSPTAMHPGPDRAAGVTDLDDSVRRDLAIPSHDTGWR